MTQIQKLNPAQMYEVCGERINNNKVKTRLAEILGGIALPSAYEMDVPVVPMAPYLATPIRGALERMKQTEGSGLKQLLLTYMKDKYSTLNAEKVDSVKPRVRFTRETRKGGLMTFDERLRLVADPMKYEGTPIGEIPTIVDDLPLSEVYQLLTGLVAPELAEITSDISDFLQKLSESRIGQGRTASERYYLGISALNQVYGVGANIGGNENPNFYVRVVEPAVLEASRKLGVTPVSLCVDLPTGNTAREITIPSEVATNSNELIEKLRRAKSDTVAQKEGEMA